MTTTLRKVKVVDNYKEQLSEKISILTKQGMYKAATRGQAVGKVVYGYNMSEDKTLVINETEADNVRRIYLWAEEGNGVRKIANLLKESEIPTPSESRKNVEKPTCVWNKSTVLYMLRNKVYTGIYAYGIHSINGEIMEIEGNHEAIISEEQFEKVREILKERVY